MLDLLKYELPVGTWTLDMNNGKILTISYIFHSQWFYSIGLGGMPMVFNGSLPSPKQPIRSNGLYGWKATIGIGVNEYILEGRPIDWMECQWISREANHCHKNWRQRQYRH